MAPVKSVLKPEILKARGGAAFCTFSMGLAERMKPSSVDDDAPHGRAILSKIAAHAAARANVWLFAKECKNSIF